MKIASKTKQKNNRHAWPVLAQYHPKQLFELMNSGKIKRVKAILMHLTRCIVDTEMNNTFKSKRICIYGKIS